MRDMGQILPIARATHSALALEKPPSVTPLERQRVCFHGTWEEVMHRHALITMVVIVVAWGTMLLAQGDVSQSAPNTREIILTGCVTEGAAPGTFILSNATARPDMQDIARTFRLVSAGADVDFSFHADHQVQATGLAELSIPPEPLPGERVDPGDLPAFAVSSIRNVSERCLTGSSARSMR